jgi:hypothetical protein
MKSPTAHILRTLAMFLFAGHALAAPLDFTKGAKPDASGTTVPLELDGVSGIPNASENGGKDARQIYISSIKNGAAAAGVLRVGDVLLGVRGKPFASAAVEEFTKAATEAKQPGKDNNLRLIHWRAGVTRDLDFPVYPPPPDLTKGGKKTATPDWNLGPTGMKGWIFNRDFDTSDARQILIGEVTKGSPADGLLAAGDVIVGLNGQPFLADARVSFGQAITAAETTANRGQLKLMVWSKGTVKAVTVPLKVMGAYTETSPFQCPKAKLIVEQGCRAIIKRGLQCGDYSPDNWDPSIPDNVNALALLASGNPEYLPVLKAYAHKLGPPQMNLPLKEGMYAWSWSYANLFLAEYYLATKDDYVFPAIREITKKIAMGQGAVGTYGHGFRVPGNNGTLGGYGAINQAGLICWMSMALAQQCGVNDPVVKQAVEKSRTFFSFYIHKGSIPYGDHPPYWLHDDNGKSGAAAVTFDILNDQEGAQFFSRMSTAAYGEKELGHTGNYLGYLWGALSANRAGPAAVAAFLKEQRWYYDLARRWDGSFFTIERDNYNWDMTGLFVLHYAVPLQKIHITGKGTHPGNFVKGATLQEILEGGRDFNLGRFDYAYIFKSNEQLLKALGNWSPTVRQRAAKVLATRKDDLTPQLITMLSNKDLNTRYGACLALQYLEGRAAAATDALITQLSEQDMWLRVRAAFALTCIGRPAMKAVPQLLKMSVVANPADPRGLEAKYLSYALFRADFIDQIPPQPGLVANSLEGVDRDLVYPALRRMLASDDGLGTFAVRSMFKTLSTGELKTLEPEIIKVANDTAPSGEMYAQEIRVEAMKFLAKNKIVKGLPVFIEYAKTQNGWGQRTRDILPLLKEYGAAAREILPQLKALQTAWKTQEIANNQTKDTRSAVAEDVIKTIEAAN